MTPKILILRQQESLDDELNDVSSLLISDIRVLESAQNKFADPDTETDQYKPH